MEILLIIICIFSGFIGGSVVGALTCPIESEKASLIGGGVGAFIGLIFALCLYSTGVMTI